MKTTTLSPSQYLAIKLQQTVSKKLSKSGVNSAFMVGVFSEMMLMYWYDYANEARDMIPKMQLKDVLQDEIQSLNKHTRNKLEGVLKEQKELLLNSFKKFENAFMSVSTKIDEVNETNRNLMYQIQDLILKHLEQILLSNDTENQSRESAIHQSTAE